MHSGSYENKSNTNMPRNLKERNRVVIVYIYIFSYWFCVIFGDDHEGGDSEQGYESEMHVRRRACSGWTADHNSIIETLIRNCEDQKCDPHALWIKRLLWGLLRKDMGERSCLWFLKTACDFIFSSHLMMHQMC